MKAKKLQRMMRGNKKKIIEDKIEKNSIIKKQPNMMNRTQ